MTGKRDHGDGAIDQRGKDRWRPRYRVGGKRYNEMFGTKPSIPMPGQRKGE
jgi:hypothetical protein